MENEKLLILKSDKIKEFINIKDDLIKEVRDLMSTIESFSVLVTLEKSINQINIINDIINDHYNVIEGNYILKSDSPLMCNEDELICMLESLLSQYDRIKKIKEEVKEKTNENNDN